jgi:hypothetical protein
MRPYCPDHWGDCQGGQPIFQVGEEAYGFFHVYGTGRSWEEAFARSERVAGG